MKPKFHSQAIIPDIDSDIARLCLWSQLFYWLVRLDARNLKKERKVALWKWLHCMLLAIQDLRLFGGEDTIVKSVGLCIEFERSLV